jgi:hypothetical protein
MLLLGARVLGALEIAREVEQVAEFPWRVVLTVSSERLRKLKLMMFSDWPRVLSVSRVA